MDMSKATVGGFLIINRTQAIKLLANVKADILFSDREMVVEGMMDGTLLEQVTDFSNIHITDLIGEMDFVTEFLYGEYEDINGIMLYDEENMDLHIVDVADYSEIRRIVRTNCFNNLFTDSTDSTDSKPPVKTPIDPVE